MPNPPNNEPQTIHYHQRRPIAEGHIKTSHAVNGAERIEEGALGNVEVPSEHLWGPQTEWSRHNFPIGVERYRWGDPLIRALGILKKCAALAREELGQLSHEKVELIVRAAQEVIDGKLDGEFALVVFQTGPARSSETAIRRGVELATFSSKRVWLALLKQHALERIETSGLAGVPSTRATRRTGWHRLCKGTKPTSEGQTTMNK